MTLSFKDKIAILERRLQSLESAVVAFSGGVDSSVLLACAKRALGDNVIAVTALSPSLPNRDKAQIPAFCSKLGIRHLFVETSEFDDRAFTLNPEDRCYHCKLHLLRRLTEVACEHGFNFVIEGTNASDLLGHRPGFKARQGFERVVTPLVEAGLNKQDVRELASKMGLPNALKPASACLASRVPHGETITAELLRRIDAAEEAICRIGAAQVRVRHHKDIARIEVEEADMALCLKHRHEIIAELRNLGWKFVTIDLAGYREGGMRG
jgi:uncharacterized protein